MLDVFVGRETVLEKLQALHKKQSAIKKTP
jgi:hypothetical protein